eukprot:7382708-Prymnesium_polylepis.2
MRLLGFIRDGVVRPPRLGGVLCGWCGGVHSHKRSVNEKTESSRRARTSMPPRLFFVRHGEAAHNPFIVQGKAEPDPERAAPLLRQGRSILNPRLTDKGREQAAVLRKQLEESGQTFDLLITSPLARAVETSHLAFGAASKAFMVTPELVETAEPHLGGPQRVRCITHAVAVALARALVAEAFCARAGIALSAACPPIVLCGAVSAGRPRRDDARERPLPQGVGPDTRARGRQLGVGREVRAVCRSLPPPYAVRDRT